jgi:class 3 adenylate cyclase
MIDGVQERGGIQLKFGGDALLSLFSGSDHATQAACAAVEMRRELRNAVRGTTALGRIQLRMSAGVESGASHGPARPRTARTSNALYPLLCAKC